MRNKYDIGRLLVGAVGGAKIYPGIFLSRKGGIAPGADYAVPDAPPARALTSTGTPLYAPDPFVPGQFYFMPVTLGGVEIPCAVVSLSGRKTIVETPLAGGRGTVKELVSIDDYALTVAGVLFNGEDTWPEEEIRQIKDLYERNEAVELVCALTDAILPDDKVVIRSISWPGTPGVETMQAVRFECVTDAPFELEIV